MAGLIYNLFLYLVPLLRYGQNCKLLGYDDPLTHIITRNVTTPAPVIAGTPVTSKGDVREHFGKLLHSSVDGKGLLYHPTCPKVHQWVRTAHHKWLTGRDFIRAVHLRHNFLPQRHDVVLPVQRTFKELPCVCECTVYSSTHTTTMPALSWREDKTA
ncbi:hypothetical protein EB796_006453 [Bugula neritina]|uniref:Secreted protein n=1 Tax=Bugula neritina TaxID=10212 RepID=A0A7J7K9D4_BUGNE|nr:hypothetical protein EB796_006453 [Bugula neritina]